MYSAARWRKLPRDLPAACSRLVTGLRDLKDGSGLTLTELPRATAISKSGRPVGTAVGVFLACAAMVTPAAVIHASRSAAAGTVTRPPVCQLRSCEGRNPRTTACEDPVTTASHTAADGTRLEIRLSPSCRAGWIRARPTHPGFRIEITGPDARPQSAVDAARPAAEDMTTTTMIAAPHPADLHACYHPSLGHADRECFDSTG
ncbi:DUF2690 domain-containing protein [Streptomyces sp. NPDC006012]|uniref:DUF2690 domain-containing protein n=1 Tax=Streptomyces sp. NPDC006012 TaxID=3364739 RepID=UPI0036BB6B6A